MADRSTFSSGNERAHDQLLRQRKVMAMRRHLRELIDDSDDMIRRMETDPDGPAAVSDEVVLELVKSVKKLCGIVREVIDLVGE